MATLTNSTNFTGSITITKASGTKVTFDTDKKYITKDIELTIDAQTATPAFTGGGVSGTASASATNASISDSTNNSGVSIVAAGSATRGQVTYNGAVGGWVTKANGAEALAAGSATALTNKTYYINGVTIPIPSTGTNSFTVTLPNGENDTIDLLFEVDAQGNSNITEDENSSSSGESFVTDLTGTTWLWDLYPFANTNYSIGTTFTFSNISFTSNNTNYSSLEIYIGYSNKMGHTQALVYGTTQVYESAGSVWQSSSPNRTITFTGGTDATNKMLLGLVQAYATRVS